MSGWSGSSTRWARRRPRALPAAVTDS
jgi:hypothetical protein